MINYYDGRVDKRVTLRTTVSGGWVNAIQMNSDGSTESICFDDLEYGREVREADVIVDATDADYKLEALYNAHKRLGLNGIYAQVGDICRVVKGNKYAIGTILSVTKLFRYYVPNTYNKKWQDYLCFEQNNKEERVPAKNVIIVDNQLLADKRLEEKRTQNQYRVYIKDKFGPEFVIARSLESAILQVKGRLIRDSKNNEIERVTKYYGCKDGLEDWQEESLESVKYLIPEVI